MAKKFATVDTIEDTKDYSDEALKKMTQAGKSLEDVIAAALQKLDSYKSAESGEVTGAVTAMSSSIDSSGASVEGAAESVPMALKAQVEAAVSAIRSNFSNFNTQLTSGLKNKQAAHKSEIEKNKNVIDTFTAF